MSNPPKEIHVYKLPDGTCPYAEWFDSIKDKKTQSIIMARLFRVPLGLLGDCKSIGDDVSELRIHYGSGYRIYFTIQKEVLVILLMGGTKSSQVKDINMAKRYKKSLEAQDE